MNCCVRPATMAGVAGVTVIDSSIGPVIVRADVPETEPEVAVMVAEPAETPVARPPDVMEALDVSEEVQVTEEEMSCVVASL